MQKTESIPSFVTALEAVINTQKKDFLETSYLLGKLVFCDSEDYDTIVMLRLEKE